MSAEPILTVARYDRERLSLERLQALAADPRTRPEVELMRQAGRTKRDVVATYLREQLAEMDELLQRLDLVLDEGVNA